MRKVLDSALDAYRLAEGPEARAAAEREIWRRYGREVAVFVLDLAGFTRGIAETGLVAHLVAVRDLQSLTKGIFAANDGETIKHDADNCYGVFADVFGAVTAAEDCLEQIFRAGSGASVGIAYGPVLFIGGDIHGHPVNIASKLGEDIAVSGEILIDAAAAAMLNRESRAAYASRQVAASGFEFSVLARAIRVTRGRDD